MMNDNAPERSPFAEAIQKSQVHDIAHMRHDLLKLIVIAGLVGFALIATVNPFILSLSPAAARTTRTNYMVLTPLLLLGVSLFFYQYLRPLKELALHLDMGRPPSPELAQRARRLALETPVYLLSLPIIGALGLSLLVVAVSSMHKGGYIFAHQAPSAVLATTVTTGIALLVAMRARRILTPVLLATTDYAVEEDAGFRFDIRTRQRLISGILTSISIAFLAVLGYVVVYHTALEELQQRYILLSDVITQDFAALGERLRPWDEATLLAYLEQLSVREGIFSTLVDAEGHYRSDIPPAFADLGLPPERLKEHLAPTTPTAFEVHDGAALLVPLFGTQRGFWLIFLYRAAPFKLASARRASIILLVFVIGMMAFVWVSSHYLSQDLSHDIRYVTQQFKQLATEAPSKAGDALTTASTAHEIPVTSRDEVGDLVRAFNALQREIQMQQQQLAREQQDLLTLQMISTHISALRQLDQLLDAIPARVAEAFRGDSGRPRYTPLILLTDPGKKVLRLHGHSFMLPLGDEGGVLGNVAKTGQPAHIPDVAQDETYLVPDDSQPMGFIHARQSPLLPIARPIEVDALPTSALVMPMISSGEMIGVFSVEAEGGFSACDERIITALANQTAVAIHNAQLYTALEEQRQTANGLVQMAQVINSTLELNQVLNLALESLGYLVPYDNASILLTERGKLQLVAQQGLDSSSHDRMPWQSPGLQRIGEEILETQQVRLIADMSALTHRQDTRRASHRKEGGTPLRSFDDAQDDRQDVGAVPRSWVAAPLVVHGHSIGLLTVSKMEAFAYQAEASQRVAAFAEQVATAVQNARLYQTMLARAQELALLHEVSQRITGLLDVPLLLREITERVAEVFGYQVISIHLVDQEDASLTFAAQRGVNAEVAKDWQQPLSGQGIVPWVARHRAPAVVPDVTSDPRYVPLREGIRSELAIPLIAGESLIGVFNVESESPDAFNDSDVRLMTALGHQVTAALENARLFESVQAQAHDLAHMAGALTEEKRKLDAILRNIADGLLVTDPQGAIIMVNPAFETMFGQRDALSTGQPVHEQALVHLIQQAVDQPMATFSTEIAKRDGRTFKATAAAIQEDDGVPGETPASRLLGVVTVVRDISQEKAIERMKSDFVTTVSHELRTPLTSVLGFAKLIGRTFQKDILPRLSEEEQQDRHIQRALRRIARNLDIMIVEGERLTRLLEDVLDISKMESGKVEWQDVEMDLMACIQEVVASYRGQAQEKGLSLEVRSFGGHEKDEVGSAKASLSLPQMVADRERIAQVLENLLSNAVKFTETGKITVSVRPLAPGEKVHGWQATEAQDGGVLVAMEDTGPGIAVEGLPRLFHRFQQLVTDTLTDKPRGTGLGLAICKEIVEHYGGTIWAESTLDVGTTFYFTLPRRPKEPMTS
jgi:PAS domain S-box-containing protein